MTRRPGLEQSLLSKKKKPKKKKKPLYFPRHDQIRHRHSVDALGIRHTETFGAYATMNQSRLDFGDEMRYLGLGFTARR